MANGTINPAKMVGLSNERNRPRVAGPSDIYDQILASIVDQRLLPGAKLNELALSEIFNVGRRQISQVLMRLAYDGLITLHANRGAFVSSPGFDEAKDVLRARKLVEPQIALHAAENRDPADLERLRFNVREEGRWRYLGRSREAVRLSGEFHIILAEMAGSATLERVIRQLVARTSLIVGLYENEDSMVCWHEEHDDFVNVIETGNGAAAAAFMLHHLEHLEASIDLSRKRQSSFDLRAIYAPQTRP